VTSKYTEKIQVRMTKEQKELLSIKAEECDMKLSDYIRTILEHKNFTILKDGKIIAQELMKIRMKLENDFHSEENISAINKLVILLDKIVASLPQNNEINEFTQEIIDEEDAEDEDFIFEGDLI